MKFGPVSPREARSAPTAVHTIRQDGLVLKKGTLIGAGRGRRARSRRHQGRSSWRGSSRATSPRTRRRPRSPRRSRARACMSTAPSPGAPTCSPRAPACWSSTRTAIDALNRVDEAITFATLPAYKPVVDGEMIATVKIIPFAVAATALRQAALAQRGAKPVIRVAPYTITQGRRRLDAAAGPRAEGDRQDAEGHRGAARAGRRDASSPSGACRTSRRRSPRRSTRCSTAGAELVIVFGASAIADRARRHPGGDRGGRRQHRAFRHAGRSRQSAADRRRRAASRCSARRAARARRRRTASTGC